MSLQLEIPQLDMAEDEAQRRFDELQKKLISIWETIDELDRGNDPLSGSVFIDDQEVATFEDIEKFSW